MTAGSATPEFDTPAPKKRVRRTNAQIEAEMRERIRAEIVAESGPPVIVAPPPSKAELAAPSMPAGRVTIMLERNPNIPPPGQFFCINGASFLLKSGVKVSVPKGIVDILNHAIESIPVVDDDKQITEYQDRLRYPYRVFE